MTTITISQIREKGAADSPNATLSFDGKGQYPLTITNPLSPQEEKRLEWYFEKYLEFPFLEEVKFRDARESITKYGQTLFEQLFSDHDAYSSYIRAREEGLENLRFEIIGSPEFFQQLHWEALRDPKWPTPFVLEAHLVRNTFQPPLKEAKSQVSPTINLLVVTARPGKNDVGYRTISKPLVESLRKAKIPVKVDVLRPGTYEALSRHLDAVKDEHGQGYYHIIHFDLHGALARYDQLKQGTKEGSILFQTRYGRADYPAYEGCKAFLFFESSKPGQSDPAEAQEIAGLLLKHSIPIAILNACQSAKLTEDTEASVGSRLLEAGVQTVVAMGYSVTVSAAALMMTELYRQLFKDRKLGRAVCYARKALHDNKNRKAYYDQTVDLEDWMLPVVYQSGGALVEPTLSLRDFTASEEEEYWQKQSRIYQAPDTTYGFVGRDLDVLEIERRLLATSEGKRRNMLLIQGMGGSGKTTLLRHLMEWWQITGFIEQPFYFGYDQRAWNASQIMDDLAQKLLGDKLAIFRTLNSPAAQRKMLGQKLCSERYLLVLDNMESITGSTLAIKNTLKPEEQQELRAFLAELLGGETLVLMGSRSPEDWLAEGEGAPMRPNDVYRLPGLDCQAATTLAERVMERHVPDSKKREAYRRSEEFQRLMKLLDGYPLPIQVVLANLAYQTPGQVMEALKEGGVMDKSGGQDKTENIMLCIEYSHGNLAPNDQRVLLALAPFTGVVFQPLIEQYIEYLKQQPALKDLSFQSMPEVLQQAQDWGLVTADRMKGYLRLQPVLPYFLRTRLNQAPEVSEAVQVAYRALYDDFAGELIGLMQSKDAQEKQVGQVLAGQEYENLYTALEMDLKAKESIYQPYKTLSLYLDSTREQERGLKISQMVLAGLEGYPAGTLQGPIGEEIGIVIDKIAAHQLSLKRYAEAEASYKKALKILESLTILDDERKALVKAGIYLNLGIVAQGQRQWTQAEEYYQKALQIYIDFDDRYSQAGIYLNLGMVAQKQRQWTQAEEYCQKALQIYIDFDDRYRQAGTYHNLGRVAQEQRQWTQAEEYYQKALQIYIDFDDRYSQAGIYLNLGIVAQGQRQWTQAEEYYQKALQIYIDFDDRYSQASTYHNLGIVAQEQRQWTQAEEYYQKALQIYIDFDDRYSQAGIYLNLGMVAQKQRQWTQAEEYCQKALQIYIAFDDQHSQASTYLNLGTVAQEQGQWDIARGNLLKSLEIFVEFGDQHNSAIALCNLADLWQATTDQKVLAEMARTFGISQEDARKLLEGEG